METTKFAIAEQGTEEWFIERIPYVTASDVAKVMAGGSGATRRNYLIRKLCENLSGQPTKTYKSAKMQDGNDRESTARVIYEKIKGLTVTQLPFAYLEDEKLGASTDGEVDEDGIIEIKNVMSSEQVALLSTGKIKSEYLKQMNTQMYVLNKKWCDFVSVALGDEESGELPDQLKVKIIRVYRDEELILKIRKEVAFFHHDLQELINKFGEKDGKLTITSDPE